MRASLCTDPITFWEDVRPQIRQKLTEEVLAINGVEFRLALKIQLRKDNPGGSEEYTDPVLRHKLEAVLQTNEIDGTLDRAFPSFQETLGKWTQRGSGWVIVKISTL